jgi:hypothetical protein
MLGRRDYCGKTAMQLDHNVEMRLRKSRAEWNSGGKPPVLE